MTRTAASILAALLLWGCAGGPPVRDLPVRIGRPYRVGTTTYVPAANPTFDMLGYASWYGNESGNRTANGERFRARWLTAAHPTLPLPTYVEVTALDSGRRIVVRINDRGPFAGAARIIDLSKGAAEALGFRRQGSAAVRVRRIEPDDADRARLRRGRAAHTLPPVSERVLANLRGQLAAAHVKD
ncbi:septal ring lytic transglycosylase RlpA family protein [Sphingomonas sp. KR1UV-12]|uniref:Endolytic peptidoglycan transglycosylase RlpA n=1 Tax=Sphingomonas aurea TaxID=3063994 RepID=A0ABT9ELJ0_9SPHN|nr:septal ring lytic transglycosylase RlpA family protein [Sphingomonas sp. KR1UV-12]MDP1027835.1 septal ring lytic transglycosylase RlpA family protein [Sphingomonas sp. KR1UV-12]